MTEEQWREKLSSHSEWPKVPQHTQRMMVEYLAGKYRPARGTWLHAVLCNSLTHTVVRADDMNRRVIVPIAGILYDKFPIVAYGSEEQIQAWMEREGEDE